jgi:hypothetical protein
MGRRNEKNEEMGRRNDRNKELTCA